MHTHRTLWASLLLCSLLAPGQTSAQSSGTGEQPSFRSGVELVTVEVGVTDKQGRPIPGLRAEDFTVTVAGEPRRVVTAEFIDAGNQAARTASAERPAISTNEGAGVGRQFVFVVDNNTLELGEARHITRAASRFFSQLTMFDRSSLVSLPIGPRVGFTWAHDRVAEALQRAGVGAGTGLTWEFGSLSEARDIATRGSFALREVAMRECSGSIQAGGGFGGGAPAPPAARPGQSAPQSGGSTSGSGSTGQPAGSAGAAPSGGGQTVGSSFGTDQCAREIQSRAEMAWSMARANSLSSITAMRQLLAMLGRVQGDKVLVLISGGWPLDDSDETTLVRALAADAAAARVTVFSLFVSRSTSSASRRFVSYTHASDQNLFLWPLENMSGLTGGRSFRADAGAEGIFDRIARELSGHYRLGVERNATDAGSNERRMNVHVSRSGAAVRARGIFDVKTYEDRDWSARLAAALEGPGPATAVGLRVTSYVSADPENPAAVRLLLAGSASRLQPGDATLQIVVRDLDGKRIVAGEQRLTAPQGRDAPFAANVPVPPGKYVVRLALQDAAGRVGSVDHWVEARPVSFSGLSVTGPLLVQVSAAGRLEPRFALDGVAADERLALEVGLHGDGAGAAEADVTFEIADSPEGPALLEQPATLSRSGPDSLMLAHAVADVRLLPPGQYFARAKVTSGSEVLGEVQRAFTVLGRTPLPNPELTAGAVRAAATATPASIRVRAVAAAPRFAVDHVLSPPVLGLFLDRVAARPDATDPVAGELLTRARAGSLSDLNVSDSQAAQVPVAAFVEGLTLLAQKKWNPAGQAFRSAMRASPDFYPAMVYLGACYAAMGNDKEAAAIWRTALIREGDARALHLLLVDALLRQGNAELASQAIATARTRWPEDGELKRRFVIAALGGANAAAGLQALDELLDAQAADESTLALGLLVLYDSLTAGRVLESAEQDRARMMRLADAYRARGGPSAELVEAWVAAVKAP
jgi:VWFA-related protein